jgi:hypothetical protein
MSAEGRAELEVVLQKAKEHALPLRAIENRVAEGLAKGASEAQIILAASALEARLEATQPAMFRAGREQPTSDEVDSGAGAMERGVTEAQLEALVEHSPSERSLVVAFDVLSSLAASGRPVAGALAQVAAKLDARAPDSAIASIAGGLGLNVNANANANANANSNAPAGAGASSAGTAGTAGSASGAVRGALQAGANVSAKVGGVIR